MLLDKLVNPVLNIQNSYYFNLLKEKVSVFDWNRDIHLTKNAIGDKAFKDCFVIQMLSSPLMQSIRNINRPYTTETIDLINLSEQVLNPIIKKYNSYYFLKAHMVALKPMGSQEKHIDSNFYHKFSLRLVLPIITNPNALYFSNGSEFWLEPGIFYEINNSVVHASSNKGSTIRTHLFIDLVPSENVPLIEKHYQSIN